MLECSDCEREAVCDFRIESCLRYSINDGCTSGIDVRLKGGEDRGEVAWDDIEASGEESEVVPPVNLCLVFLVRTRVCPPKMASSSSASLSD